MLIPLRTDRDLRRRPVVTETLIIVNVLVYLAGMAGPYFGWFAPGQMESAGAFKPYNFQWWALFAYQFLHQPGGWPWHILFNMVFLWVFGSAVEDRVGRISFLAFYLIGGAVAGLGHMQITNAPVIGASGSVAAVTGAFLALFPRSTIKILLIFFIIGIFHIPSLWFVGFYFLVDVLRQFTEFLAPGQSRIAYMAHIAGYVYGFSLAFTLLALRIIKREDVDIFYLWTQSRRRAAFRQAQREVKGGLWDAPVRAPVMESHKEPKPREMTEEEREFAEQRAAIARLIADHDLPAAAERYRELLSRHPEIVLAEDRQLDLANQLAAEGDHKNAARAYEMLLEKYPRSAKADEVRLILGMICMRHLGLRDRARELLEKAKAGLRDAKQLAMAERLLAEVG